jgi:hypothetical protein
VGKRLVQLHATALNDYLIVQVTSRRVVMTRAQGRSRPSTDGRSQQLRRLNASLKLSNVMSRACRAGALSVGK